MQGLGGKQLLIVEDDFLVALDLAEYFAKTGAVVLGPVPDLRQGMPLADRAEAAVLDIGLRGETIFPLAARLDARRVPYVFYSGCEDIEIPAEFRHAGLLRKPEAAAGLAFELLDGMHRDSAEADDVFRLLPKLRLTARLILNDAAAADRLVEATLEAAVDQHPDERSEKASLGHWLTGIMRCQVQDRGQNFLN